MSNIKLFESSQIRSIWSDDDQKWYFSVVDVVAALTESPNPRDYWYRIKQREKISGIELSTICRQFKLEAPDGKLRETDCSHAEGLLRIIQSTPSPKAEPFKRWLAKVGMAKKPKTPLSVETLTHDEATRKNIPTAEYESVMHTAEKSPVRLAYERGVAGLDQEKQRRNRDLEPQLVWRGKDEQDWSDLVVHAPPLYIQEKVHPKVLIDDLRRRSEADAKAAAAQVDMFADFNEESFFVRHAYFLGANDPYKALKTTLKAEINEEAWASLNSDTSRPFDKPKSGRIAVKVINHLGDEVMKVFRV